MEKTAIIAKVIGEFGFLENYNGFLYNSFSAYVDVEVLGNTYNINIATNNRNNKYKIGEIITNIMKLVYPDTNGEGEDIDMGEVIYEYKNQLSTVKKSDRLHRIRTHTKEHNEHWIHEFINNETYNKRGIEIIFPDMEKYIRMKLSNEYSNFDPIFKYRDIKISISYYKGNSSNSKAMYSFAHEITKYKRRNYTNVNHMLDKIRLLGDFHIGSVNAELDALENRKQTHERIMKHLDEHFPGRVKTGGYSKPEDRDYKNTSYVLTYNPRPGNGYVAKLEIQWNILKDEYTFAHIHNLSLEQVKEIYAILVKGA